MVGRTVVVTGATSGIGLELTRQLGRRGARVIGVGRSAARVDEAAAALARERRPAPPEFLIAELGSQRQVRRLAAEILARVAQVDVLIHNAAEVPHWYQSTEDGYERQFAVNHLASFLLTYELAPALAAAEGARIVTVGSGSHRGARVHWPDVMLRHRYQPLRAYRQSKLANVLFSYELNRRRAVGSRVAAFVADPGLVNTAIGSKGSRRLMRWIWEKRRRRGIAAEAAAADVAFVALDPAVRLADGIYWKDRRPVRPSRDAERPDDAARLWELSERLCGLTFGPKAAAAGAASAEADGQDLASESKLA
jgi:NAD(P)-dependent dehydrogenase (short-subunit alcohol dehydrogenase family)